MLLIMTTKESRRAKMTEYLHVTKACWRPLDGNTWKKKRRRETPLYFYIFLHSGLKDFLLQICKMLIRVTNLCVRVCVRVCVCLESAIMRINSQSWERAVPGYHTQTSSLTSTGRTGGHGWGDYVSAEARTETRSEKKEKKKPTSHKVEARTERNTERNHNFNFCLSLLIKWLKFTPFLVLTWSDVHDRSCNRTVGLPFPSCRSYLDSIFPGWPHISDTIIVWTAENCTGIPQPERHLFISA